MMLGVSVPAPPANLSGLAAFPTDGKMKIPSSRWDPFSGGGEIKLDAHILLNFLVMTADEDDWMGIWVVATSNIFGIFTPKLGEDTPF